MNGQKDVTPLPEGMTEAARKASKRGLPPVHLWNPPFCGNIDMRICRDGRWIHEGGEIRRPAMVRLFASILKREGDDYFLVTPAEKVGITVEDVPFVAVDVTIAGEGSAQTLHFETNVGDHVTAGSEALLRMGGGPDPVPYITVRAGLEARIDRKSFYRMVEHGCHHDGWFGLWSAGVFLRLMPSADLEM